MTSFVEDLRYAGRVLRKSPGFTVVAVTTLALGIGANTAIFSVLNGVLLRPLPYPEAGRLLIMYEKSPEFDSMSVAYLNFLDWRNRNRTCEDMAAIREDDFNLTGAGDPERLRGRMASASFFSILGVKLALGRTFLPEEDKAGGAPVVVLGDGFWARRFGRDPGVIGRTLTLSGIRYTVVGIAPADFYFRRRDDVFVPIGQWKGVGMRDREYHPGIHVIARRKPGVPIEQVRADLNGVARQLANEYPKSNAGHSVRMDSLKDDIVGNVRQSLWVLLGAVVFVLLIACANVANLLLARATARQKEIAIRAAMGANRWRLLRQLLTESALLSLCGGALGLAIASWGVDLGLAAVPDSLPRADNIGVDGTVLAFTLLASLGTGVLFGLAPALQLAGSDLRDSLKEAGRGLAGGRHRLRDLLVIGEMALALVLLTGAGLMIRSIVLLADVHPGFDSRNVLTLQVALSPANTSTADAVRRAYTQLLDRIETIPGVESAAINMNLPLVDDSESPVWIEGRPRPASMGDMPWAIIYPASPEYLRVMRIPLLRGRFFTEQDTARSPRVVVIDDVMARSVFAGQDPIGKRLTLGGPDIAGGTLLMEIVGIVDHVRHWGLDADDTARIRSQLYMPHLQIPDDFLESASAGTTIVLRANANPLEMAAAVRAQVTGADRDQPVYNVRSMERIVAGSMAQRRFSMLLMGVFAGIALLLAAGGIYGLMSYSISQRTREIGLRMALGARRGDVLRLVVGRGAVLALLGVAIGVIAAIGVTRALATLLFGVSATDPATFAGVSCVLAAVALAASYLPARRAAKVDPMAALRHE
jgi:predicted permease